MEPTEKAAPGPAVRGRRRLRSEAASPARSKKTLYVAAACAVITLVGIFAFYWFVLADHNIHHELPVAWPKDAPTGEPVVVHHGVKPGDVFVTTLLFQSGIKLGFGQGDPLDRGMNLDGELTIAQQVEAKEGGGLTSRVRVLVERCDALYAPMKESVWKVLGSRKDPYALAFDRQPSGRPDRKSAKGPGAAPERRDVLDSVTSGIGDVVTTWLPDHDVRLGEAWDLLSVADVHNLAPFLQRVAGSDVNPSGFPACVVKGMGAAEAVESREGEPCLRVRIVAYVTQEGTVTAPAIPGWISAVVRVDGHAWISTATGIVWALETVADMKSSYCIKGKAEERFARQVLRGKTARAAKMPE